MTEEETELIKNIHKKESIKMRQWWVWLSEWKTEVAGCSVGDLEESQRFIKHFYEIRCAKMHRRHILVSNHTNSTAASKMQCFVFCRITVAFYSIISLLFSHYQICFVFVLFSCTEVIFFFFFIGCHHLNAMQKRKQEKKKDQIKHYSETDRLDVYFCIF